MDVESMTVSELKRELKSRDLKVGGKKAELKARLLEALNESPSASASTANTEEHPTDSEAPQTDFADFENYINVRILSTPNYISCKLNALKLHAQYSIPSHPLQAIVDPQPYGQYLF